MDIYLKIQRNNKEEKVFEKVMGEIRHALKNEKCQNINLASLSHMEFSGPHVPVFPLKFEDSIYSKRLTFVHSGQISFIVTEENLKLFAKIKLKWVSFFSYFLFFMVLASPLFISWGSSMFGLFLLACGSLMFWLCPLLLFTELWVKRIMKKAVKSSGYGI